MQVQILVAIAGNANPTYGLPEFSYLPGQLVDVDSRLAAAWIASGISEAYVASSANCQFADSEVPQATANPLVFTLASTPNPPGSLKLHMRGLQLNASDDFVLSGNQITYAQAPEAGATQTADYRY